MLTALKDKILSKMKFLAICAYGIGLTPNMATLIGFMMAITSAICYNLSSTLFASFFYLLSGFFDVLDGMIASLLNKSTTWGGFSDSLLDRYSDALVILGIISGGLCDSKWGIIALMGTLLVSYARARGDALNIDMASVGLGERAERILIIFAVSLFSLVYEDAISLGMILLAIITHATVLQRAHYVWKNIRGKNRNTA